MQKTTAVDEELELNLWVENPEDLMREFGFPVLPFMSAWVGWPADKPGFDNGS